MAIERFPNCPSCLVSIDVGLNHCGGEGKYRCNNCTTTFSNDVSRELDVKNQPHYAQFKIPIMLFCQANKLSWAASNAIKYVCRENSKNGIEDLRKAIHYIECLIEYKETGDMVSLKESNKNYEESLKK